MKPLKICICGGGGLGHTCAGVLSSHENVTVNMFTQRPEKWQHEFVVNAPEGKHFAGKLDKISNDPKDVIPQSDIVFLCVPSFLVEQTILQVKPYLSEKQILGTVVSNSGFFLYCHKLLPLTTKLFGFQRVPYVSRVVEYGKEANLLGYRPELFAALENIEDREGFRGLLEKLFLEKTTLVDTFYEVTLSNSNPILHTGRLYTMWKDWDGTPFDRCSFFYKEWTESASALEIQMDAEFFALLKKLNVNTEKIETLLVHYESTDAKSMTRKIQSIESLSTILSPMKQLPEGGWVPDFTSRYFTEDFPFGLKAIHDLAHENGIDAPHIDLVYEWGMSKCR